MKCFDVAEQTTEIKLPSKIESIERAAAVADDVVKAAGFNEETAFGLDLAVREAVANAVVHGNQQDELKKVEISFIPSMDALVIEVRDSGAGFDPDAVPDPTDNEHLLRSSGRGILFMRTFMDQVQWLRHPEGGTVVRMTKLKHS